MRAGIRRAILYVWLGLLGLAIVVLAAVALWTRCEIVSFEFPTKKSTVLDDREFVVLLIDDRVLSKSETRAVVNVFADPRWVRRVKVCRESVRLTDLDLLGGNVFFFGEKTAAIPQLRTRPRWYYVAVPTISPALDGVPPPQAVMLKKEDRFVHNSAWVEWCAERKIRVVWLTENSDASITAALSKLWHDE